jgi:hypothetical protein
VGPQLLRAAASARGRHPASTDETYVVRHLLSHRASWRRIYLQGIDNTEMIDTVHGRHQPMIPVSTALR